MVERYSCEPVYDLEEVKRLANGERARWRGVSTQIRCQRDLGLSFAQACSEIAWLLPTDYDKTYHYGRGQPPDDAYTVRVHCPDGRKAMAYIKLRIDRARGELELDIGSFHG